MPILTTGKLKTGASPSPLDEFPTIAAAFASSLSGMFGENREAFATKKDAFLALNPITTDQEAREAAKRAQIEYRMASIFYWAKRRAKTAKTPVYTYIFDQAVASERGAYHGSDLAYAFNDLKDGERVWTADDRRVADQVSSYWANFVRTGTPNGGDLPEWPAFSADRPTTIRLSANSGPLPIAANDRLGFYRDLLEK